MAQPGCDVCGRNAAVRRVTFTWPHKRIEDGYVPTHVHLCSEHLAREPKYEDGAQRRQEVWADGAWAVEETTPKGET